MISKLKAIMEKIETRQDQIDNFSRGTETLRKQYMQMLRIKKKKKNLTEKKVFNEFTSRFEPTEE